MYNSILIKVGLFPELPERRAPIGQFALQSVLFMHFGWRGGGVKVKVSHVPVQPLTASPVMFCLLCLCFA